jgi:hypothetical protein
MKPISTIKGRRSWKYKNLEYNLRGRIRSQKLDSMRHSRGMTPITISNHNNNTPIALLSLTVKNIPLTKKTTDHKR